MNTDRQIDVAMDPQARASDLHELSQLGDSAVRREVASNPSTSGKDLEALANDADGEVRTAVASNPSTPAAVLSRLANDTEIVSDIDGFETKVQQCVAGNPSTPNETLLRLLAIGDCRTIVATNPAISMETMADLALDSDPDIRVAVATNLRCPAIILKALSADSDANVRVAAIAASTVAEPEDIPLEALIERAKSADHDTARDLVFLDPCPSQVLMTLVQHRNEEVRCIVATDAQLTAEAAELLAHDQAEVVRVELALNQTCPMSVLEALARDDSDWVAETAQNALDVEPNG